MSGLNRIILIDTHLPGVVELKLNGHTNICGTNASGKTTLQRLIPVFYGEYPSRVVPSTRDSFERWYLPRESSFIIYEYTRVTGEQCQAILSSRGQGVDYRLIAKGFELTDFLDQQLFDGANCITMAQLGRNMKRDDIPHSKLLNTSQFRAILQNDSSAFNNAANGGELRGFSRLFSLCEQSHNLRHIEKLAKAVHSKEGKMETIKAMIAAILEEDGVQPPNSGLSRSKVEEWINECQLIQGFDAIRPEFTKLEQANQALEQNEYRLAELKQHFNLDETKLDQKLILDQALLDEVQLNIRQHEGNWTELRDQLNQTLSAAKADSTQLENNLDQVENEFISWQDKDIETHQQNLQKLPSWQSELDNNQSKYDLLTEKHQDIEASFNRKISELTAKYSEELDLLHEQKSEQQDQLSQKRSEENQQLNDLTQQFDQQISRLQQAYREQLHELEKQQTELNSLIQHAGYTDNETTELALLDAQIKEAVDNEDISREQLQQANKEVSQAKQQRQKADENLAKASKNRHQKEQAVEAVEALLYPGQHTLLEYLRKEKPEWATDLGKVINPELLKRTDLDPATSLNNSDAFYGVLLNLAAVDTPASAQSEQALQAQLNSAQNAEKIAEENVNQAEINLAKANEKVIEKETAQAQLQSLVTHKENSRKRYQQDKEQLQQEYRQALNERKNANQKRLAQNTAAQQKLKAQQSEAIAEVRTQLAEAKLEHQAHWQQLLDDLNQQMNLLDLQISQNKSQTKNDKKQCEHWLKDELANRGVDVDDLGKLKKAINQLTDAIKVTEKHRNAVKDYQHWYKTVFSGHKLMWQKQLAEAKQVASNSEHELNKQTQHYQQQRQEYKLKQSELERTLRSNKELSSELANTIKQLKKLNLPVAEIAADNSNIDQRINEGQQTLAQREELLQDIKTYVEHFDALIAQQSGAGLSETWEQSRQECTSTNSHGIKVIEHRRLVSHLARLLNEIVPQKLHGLREQGKIFGKDLTSFYHVLVDIDKRIASQSHRISKEVDEELYLDGVSDSAVRIRSRISELDFWPELQAFDRHYQDWHNQGAHELPDQDYAFSMRKVLDILGRSALQGGISKLLDIELKIREGNSDLVIRTDRQLNESSSHGMAYLILCKFLLAFTRLLRGPSNSVIHWPIDELGTLHQSNVKKIFDACQNNHISVVGAFPNPESDVLSLFENRYLIDKKTKKLQIVQPKVSPIAARIKAKQAAHENDHKAEEENA